MKRVYFDNAATSFPKPKEVIQAMQRYMQEIGVSPGRGSYELGLEAGRVLYKTRLKFKEIFNSPLEENIIFTPNITYALNFALMGILRPGDHVITTSMEHNSVLRPLRYLQKAIGIEVTVVKGDALGNIDPEDIKKSIRKNTRVIVFTHASNVTGGIIPVEDICKLKENTDAFFIMDGAQTAGVIDIDFEKLNLDFLCFTGHKSLYGPPGTGGMVISERACLQISPIIHGGTGSRSHLEYQPDFMPDKLEAGTPNTVGIAGISAALDFINEQGIENIRKHEICLTKKFLEGLREIPKIKVYGCDDSDKRVSTVSLTIQGLDLGEAAYRLDREYGIMVRSGLHCAPLAHKTIGTYSEGTLRFSFGYFNTLEEISYGLLAIKNIANKPYCQ